MFEISGRKANRLTALLLFAVTALALGACSKESLSERDSRLEQIRNQAERKRKELKQVVGLYRGDFEFQGDTMPASVRLEIFDVPTLVEGHVDPVMVPVLTGYLHLRQPPEHEPFGIESSEYDAKLRKLTLVLKNPVHGSLYVTSQYEGSALRGRWSAPLFGGGGEGDIDLERVTEE
ncbi:MAG: hypothetical protein R3B54_07015 [Bdellovibrionota bacterium]